MRECTYYVAVTIDGRIADPDGGLTDFVPEGDHDAVLHAEFAATCPTHLHSILGLAPHNDRFDTVVMGWNTYTPALNAGITSPYAHLRQHVATTGHQTDDAAVIATGDPAPTLASLKAETADTGVWIAGGGALAAAVIDQIDHLIVKLHPVVLDDGITVFSGTGIHSRGFSLHRTRSFTSGVVLAAYTRTDQPHPAGRSAEDSGL